MSFADIVRGEEAAPPAPAADSHSEQVVGQLCAMGFSRHHSTLAAVAIGVDNVERAMDWALSHADEGDPDAAPAPAPAPAPAAEEEEASSAWIACKSAASRT